MKRWNAACVVTAAALLACGASGMPQPKKLEPPACCATTASDDIAQALIAYGYLAERFPDDFLLPNSRPATRLTKDMRALGKALGSLHCGVRKRLAMSHSSLLIPMSLAGQWVDFPRSGKDTSDSWILVIPFQAPKKQRALVILTGMGPAQTTVFWLAKNQNAYVTNLLYDSFNKGEISNLKHEMIGEVSRVKIEKNGNILLKERVAPGSGPNPQLSPIGRVFRLNPATRTMILISSRTRKTTRRIRP